MKSKTVREPIATWWKIAPYDVQITPVKVVAFSAEFVTILYNSRIDRGNPRTVIIVRTEQEGLFQ